MKRTLSLLLCLVLICTCLAGCQSNSSTQAPAAPAADSTANNAPAEGKAENVNMRFCWWGAEARHNATMEALTLYNTVYPNVSIVGEYGEWTGYVDKLLTQLASGTAPDIIQLDTKLYYDMGDFLVDLYTMSDVIDLSQYDQEFLDNYCTYNGKLVGIPTGMNATTLIFSKQFFDAHDIPYDTVWTWDNLLEIGERVHQEDPNAYLFFADPLNLQVMTRAHIKQQIGTQLVNDDYTLNITEEVLTNTFNYVKEMVDRGVCQPFAQTVLYTDVQETNPDWIAGNLGMTVKFCSLISRFTESGFDIGTAIMPQMENAKDTGVLLSVANLLSINKDSANIDDAAEFINWFMTDKDAILTLGECRSAHSTEAGRAILDEAGVSNSIVKDALDAAVANGSSFAENAVSQNQELEAIMDDAIEKVGFGQMTPAEAAAYVIETYTDVLASLA